MPARLVNRVKSCPILLKSLDNSYEPNRRARTVHPLQFRSTATPRPFNTTLRHTRPGSAGVASHAQAHAQRLAISVF
jgi:hypothetical protein